MAVSVTGPTTKLVGPVMPVKVININKLQMKVSSCQSSASDIDIEFNYFLKHENVVVNFQTSFKFVFFIWWFCLD